MIGFMDIECSIGVIKLDLDQVKDQQKSHTEDVDMAEDDIDVDQLEEFVSQKDED